MPVAPPLWQRKMSPGICQMSPGEKESALAETVWGLSLLSTPPIQGQNLPPHSTHRTPWPGTCHQRLVSAPSSGLGRECGTRWVLRGLWPQNTHWLGQVFIKCGRKTTCINGVTTDEPICRAAQACGHSGGRTGEQIDRVAWKHTLYHV